MCLLGLGLGFIPSISLNTSLDTSDSVKAFLILDNNFFDCLYSFTSFKYLVFEFAKPLYVYVLLGLKISTVCVGKLVLRLRPFVCSKTNLYDLLM